MVTRNGVIKKSELTEFDNPISRGIHAISLDEGDELIAACLSTGDAFLLLASRNGKAIRFPESEVRAMGRQARGVRGMDLEQGDYLVAAEVVREGDLILSISENGYGKRTPLKDYRITRRGGKGIINMKTTARNGKVVSVLAVEDESDVMIITKEGKIIRLEASEIRQAGRSTQGVRLVKLEPGDQVAAASVLSNGNGSAEEGAVNQPEIPGLQ
jgi:DNA gyrase subunit A